MSSTGNNNNAAVHLYLAVTSILTLTAHPSLATHPIDRFYISSPPTEYPSRTWNRCGSEVDNGGASVRIPGPTITYRKNGKWVVVNEAKSKKNLVHTCTPLAGERLSHSRQIFVEAMASPQQMVARESLRQHCTVTRTSPAQDLQKALKDKLTCDVPLQAIYRAKLAITDGDVDRQAAAFRQLPAFVERFVALQEGNVAECDTAMGASFFAPKLSQLVWKHLRPLVNVHSKSCHDYTLFLSGASDANKQSVTLAWGHAKTEKRVSRLSDCYPGLDSKVTVIMSDRGKGLVPAISNVLPLATPSHCATPEEFQRHRAKLAEPARNYIDTFDTALYARRAFPIARFGLVSSNTVEQLNGWLLVARGGDIITLFSTIYGHLRASFRGRHDLLVVKPRLVERDLIQHVFCKMAAEKCEAKDYRALRREEHRGSG
ncbi:hypothetical protein B9479_007038 [Cryptococcus floricola]|uniref:MULE transposase domain-containing protein n=1 Tax=Cryptococcus floricola TaxID=2591691 RepID=A0A5D3ANA5_9TREE|nr:hypothetical protein B9479_007038 [Cryptococcus floricola]